MGCDSEGANDEVEGVLGLARVVLRWRWVVSVLGGKGREERKDEEAEADTEVEGGGGRMEARQRKHSPVP